MAPRRLHDPGRNRYQTKLYAPREQLRLVCLVRPISIQFGFRSVLPPRAARFEPEGIRTSVFEETKPTGYSIYNEQQKIRTKQNTLAELYPALPAEKYDINTWAEVRTYLNRAGAEQLGLKPAGLGFRIFLASGCLRAGAEAFRAGFRRSSATSQGLAQFFNGPIATRVGRTHPGPVGSVDENMRAKLVLDRQNLNFGLRRPP